MAPDGYTHRGYVKYCAEAEADAGLVPPICGRRPGAFSNAAGSVCGRNDPSGCYDCMGWLLKGLGRRLARWFGAAAVKDRDEHEAATGGRNMANSDRILELLRASERPLTDSEIRHRTGIEPHQQVNQICRSLAAAGLIDRRQGPEGRLVNSAVARAAFEENADEAGGSDASVPGELPELEPDGALIVIPCSGRKRRGGTEAAEGTSVVDWLTEELARELLAARQRNAPSSRLDESKTMPAVERYAGMLYEAEAGALERIQEAGAEVAIISGGYGVALAGEPIGWYAQQFAERMWPKGLVARCLGAYAESIEATTVVGLLAGTTAYAKVFREVRWPPTVENVWLVSPELDGGGAQVKVPRAIGEALAEIADGGRLPEDWTSSDGVPLRIEVVEGVHEEGGGAADGLRLDGESGVAPTHEAEPSAEGGSAVAELTITLDGRDAKRLEVSRARIAAALAGTDAAGGRELDRVITPAAFAAYLVRTALDRLEGSGD